MKVVYPVFIKPDDGMYLVYVPDIDRMTEGHDFYDAIEMAKDLIGLETLDCDDEKKPYPKASTAEEAMAKAKEAADEILDFTDGTLTFVNLDTTIYRSRARNTAVRKNVSVPAWLNDKAERQGLNFSRVLQEALIGIVGAE